MGCGCSNRATEVAFVSLRPRFSVEGKRSLHDLCQSRNNPMTAYGDRFREVDTCLVDTHGVLLEVRMRTGEPADASPILGLPISSFLYADLCNSLVPKLCRGEIAQCSFWWFSGGPLRHAALFQGSNKCGKAEFRQLPMHQISPNQASFVDLLCASCYSFKCNGVWVPPEKFYIEKLKQGSLQVSPVSHTICTKCSHADHALHTTAEEKISSQHQDNARVVIVDDDYVSLRVAERHAKLAGFTPVCFSDPTQALEYTLSHPVDILITDVVMPGLDGLSLYSVLRENSIKCIAIAMSGMQEYEQPCRALGMDAFLKKPLTKSDFEKAVGLLTPERAVQIGIARH